MGPTVQLTSQSLDFLAMLPALLRHKPQRWGISWRAMRSKIYFWRSVLWSTTFPWWLIWNDCLLPWRRRGVSHGVLLKGFVLRFLGASSLSCQGNRLQPFARTWSDWRYDNCAYIAIAWCQLNVFNFSMRNIAPDMQVHVQYTCRL